MSKKNFYAGIGARETPLPILKQMTYIASILEKNNFILRSGGADGADKSFEDGVVNLLNKEIYTVKNMNSCEKINLALSSVKKYHPNPSRLTPYAYALMARNYFQLFGGGFNADISKFIICWTKNGKIVGGTGQALRMAIDNNIHIYNLAIMNANDVLNNILS